MNETVMAEFDALPMDMQASLARIADMIRDNGLEKTGMPHVRHLQGKLWEMRGKGRDGIARNIYVTVTGRRIVMSGLSLKKHKKHHRMR